MILLPDEYQGDIYKNEIAPYIKKGAYLAFAHGFNIHFNQIVPSPDINVFMAAPKGPDISSDQSIQREAGYPVLSRFIRTLREDKRDCPCVRVCHRRRKGGHHRDLVQRGNGNRPVR